MRRGPLLAALLLLVCSAAAHDSSPPELHPTEQEVFSTGVFQMCAVGCRLRGSPQLKAFVNDEVEAGFYPLVSVTHEAGRVPRFVVFNPKGTELYTREVEHMSTRALADMLLSFGFSRNDTVVGSSGASGNKLSGEARIVIANRRRFTANAIAAAAAEEARKKAAAAAAAREKEAQKKALEESSRKAAEAAVAAGQGNKTVNQPLSVPASAQPTAKDVVAVSGKNPPAQPKSTPAPSSGNATSKPNPSPPATQKRTPSPNAAPKPNASPPSTQKQNTPAPAANATSKPSGGSPPAAQKQSTPAPVGNATAAQKTRKRR